MTHTGNDGYFFHEMERITEGAVPLDAGVYLGDQEPPHQERLAEAWDFMGSHATPSFKGNRSTPLGVAMPISFQETQYVEHALSLYREQAQDFPLRVLGYLNWPSGAPVKEVNAMRGILRTFIADNPDIPFSFFEGEEPEPIAIGRIRKLGTDALLPLIDPDGLIVGHDADQRAMSKGHLAQIVSRYQAAPTPPAGILPDVIHERVPELPHIDLLIQWQEDPELMELENGYCEPGPAFAVRDYAEVGGYNSRLNMSETHDLIANITYLDEIPRKLLRVHNAILTLSPRRLVKKFSEYEQFSKMWTPENFKSQDDYRTHDSATMRETHDIPESMRDIRLQEFGAGALRAVTDASMHSHATPRPEALQHLEAIRHRLGGPEDMFPRF